VDFACVLTGNFRAKKRSSSLTNSAVITKEGTDHRTYTTMMGNSVPVFRVRQTKLSYFSLLDFECHAANMKRDRHLVRLYWKPYKTEYKLHRNAFGTWLCTGRLGWFTLLPRPI